MTETKESEEIRGILIGLSGVFTDLISSGEMLNMLLVSDNRQRHSAEICEAAERGAAMLRRARAVLSSKYPLPELHPVPRERMNNSYHQ